MDTNKKVTLEDINGPNGSELLYRMLFDFKGYGNPNGKYWFIGQEENWGRDFDPSKDKLTNKFGLDHEGIEYYNKITPEFDGYVEEKFWECVIPKSQDIKYFPEGILKILFKYEKDNYYNALKEEAFVANISFLPTPKDSEILKNIFNKTITQYCDIDAKNYRENIFNFWNQNRVPGRKTFCLGASDTVRLDGKYWNLFLDCFGIVENEKKKKIYDFRIYDGFEKETIYFLFHPSSKTTGSTFIDSFDKVLG